ncbi:uncharacterized protein LOC135349688 isoform X1 [Halichondria panicea]|uniref:uncharacterized protein LOC135349688 isoform X1 n=1 Tax=Halichondria panicea TaxID=6063 RepID=UPI00312B6FFD
MEFTHSRKRKQQYRPHSNPDNRDKRAAIIDDFDRGLKTPPSRSTPGHEVTVIEDDEPDQSDHGARISSGTMYDQHKTPGEYKSSSFKIPKKKLHDLTFGHDQSNETTNVGIQPMPPKSNVVDVINRAKSMKSRTTTTSKTGSTIPDFLTLAKTPYTKNKISNSMESSLPAPKKKRPFRTNPIRSESPTETTQITNFDSQKSMLWNDTCIGLEDPNSSFDTKPNSDCVRDSRKSWASISPDRDDDIASNTSSEEVDAGEIFKRPVDKKQVLPKDKTTDKAATNDVVTIHSDDDDDNDVKATTSSNFKSPLPNRFLPPKAPPKNTNDNTDKFNKLLSTTNSVLKTCSEKPTSTADSTNAYSTHRNVFAKSQAASKGKCSIQVTPTFLSKEQLAMATTHALPSTGKARDILSITDSPVLSKVEFSFEVDDEKVARTSTSSAAGTRKPLTTSRAAELPSDLARRPLKRPTQSAATPGSFYSSNGSPSNQLFSQFRSRAWGTGSSRMSSVRGNSANQVMATYGIKKPLKLKRPLPSPCSVDVDDEESLPLSVQCVQIGRLELDKVLHVELRNDVLCMKLDYEGRTETVQVSLPACFVWQLHLGEEPYIVYINVKSPEAKKIAETLSKKYHLDSDFFNPLSSNISEQCIMLRLEERPLPHLISSIIEFLTKMNVSVDQNLGTVEAKKLLNDIKPLKPSRSHGRPLSNDDVKSLVPSLNVRRSQRSRKAPVRMDPSSPITLVESIVVHNKPNVRLLAYNVPAGSKVNIEVSTHDVDTLAPGEYINDKVVDFYLRYMWYERLAERLRSKVHIFSSFFHTRLKDASRDNKELKCLQTPERQHNRVKTWTRRVDLFDKEYIVLPVCDRAHWFVAFVYKAGEFDPVRELATREAKAAKKNKKKPLKKKPDTPLDMLCKALFSVDPQEQLAAVRRFRHILSQLNNPPIEEVIRLGCLPKFVEFLHCSTSPFLQFEAAWVITNISSGSTLQTRTVIEAGAIPPLVQLLLSQHDYIREQAVWALGNIAGDSAEYRDITLSFGIMEPLLLLLQDPTLKVAVMRNATWTLSNLCRGKSPPPDLGAVQLSIPVLAKLLHSEDMEVLCNCAWSVAFIGDGPNDRIQRIVDGGLCRRLVELLFFPDKKVLAPALRAVGNILTGDDRQTQLLLNCSVLPALQHLLSSRFEGVKKEACWALSNVTAGNRVQIQTVIDCNIFPLLIEVLSSGVDYKTRKEAAWAVLNATQGGTAEQIRYLVDVGCVKPLCDLLTVQDPRMVMITLEGLENILKIGQQDAVKNVNPFALMVEEAYGLDKIEHLQQHSSEQVYKIALRIIDKYFGDDQDQVDLQLAPNPAKDGEQYMFNTNTQLPEGGFQF